jgi:hypothetical protein
MDMFLLSNLLLSVALIIQLMQVRKKNKAINPITFILIAVATFIMANAQRMYGDQSYNIVVKIINGLIAVAIVYYFYQK